MTAESDNLLLMNGLPSRPDLRPPKTVVAERRGDGPMRGRPRDVLRWIAMVQFQTGLGKRWGQWAAVLENDLEPVRIVTNEELVGELPPGATPPAWEATLEAPGA